MLLPLATNASTRFRCRRRRHRTRRTTPRPLRARSRLRFRITPAKGEGTRRRPARLTQRRQQTTLRRHTTQRHMRTRVLRLPRDTLLLAGTTITATITTTRPLSLMSPQPTSRHPHRHTAGHSQLRRRHLQCPSDMSLRCIAPSMRHQQRRLPHRRNMNRRTLRNNSTLDRPMLPMVSPPPQARHTRRRARMCHTPCTPRFLSAQPTPLTQIPLPTECPDLDLSHHRCHRRQPDTRPRPRFRDTRQMPRFRAVRWTTCQKSRIGG